MGTGRVAVLGRGPRYGTSRAHGSRQLAGVGWGEEGLERSLGPVAHGTRPAFPSGKFEQKRDRQGRMGAGRAGGRWPQGWRLVDGLRGAGHRCPGAGVAGAAGSLAGGTLGKAGGIGGW